MVKLEEQGRSMIEMMGVLAIIGLLSIAGIAAYSTAMTKHRANELLNEASKRAVLVATQLLNSNTATLSEFKNNDLGYGRFNDEVEFNPYTKQFSLEIFAVSAEVCNQMKGLKMNAIRSFEPETCGNENTIKLTYNMDLAEKDSETPYDANGACKAGYTGDNCEEKLNCGEHGEWSANGCVCDENWYGKLCDSDCDGFKDTNNNCYPCSEPNSIQNVELSESQRCDNTDNPRFICNNGRSCLCSSSTNVGVTVSDVSAHQACNEDGHQPRFIVTQGETLLSYHCDSIGDYFPIADASANQPCIDNGHPRVMASNGKSYSCKETFRESSNEVCQAAASICGDTRYIQYNYCHSR